MRVLVVGGGGREHAIVWALAKSDRIEKLYCAPGNAGIAELAQCVPVKATDIEGMVSFAKKEKIDFVVVAPDDPLYLGMVDALEAAGIRAFGPRKNAAEIEGSKVFAKNLMKKYGIPTARYETFDSADAAIAYIREQGSFPTVVKADGLALGKGVIIAQDMAEAEDAVNTIMRDRAFGDAGARVVIEEFLTGPEVSVLSFCDGETVVPMVSAQDHKRALDGDKGKNTGGMGTFSPSRIYDEALAARCMEEIFLPTVRAMKAEGRPFKGVLYFGLMITKDGPKVIEYNARFGDPETQVVLPRLTSDLLTIFEAVVDGKLAETEIRFSDNAAVCVILASGGYPEKYQTGYPIEGIEKAREAGALVFHSGTKREGEQILTNGGRVLGVTAVERDLDRAIEAAYRYVEQVHFKDAHFRRDIGIK